MPGMEPLVATQPAPAAVIAATPEKDNKKKGVIPHLPVVTVGFICPDCGVVEYVSPAVGIPAHRHGRKLGADTSGYLVYLIRMTPSMLLELTHNMVVAASAEQPAAVPV